MTDSRQAEGWWRAPDGQWYPPDDNVETHDFEVGYGPVPSHRHPNGGGWVANTATVDETAFVGPLASVSIAPMSWTLHRSKTPLRYEVKLRFLAAPRFAETPSLTETPEFLITPRFLEMHSFRVRQLSVSMPKWAITPI